MIERNCLAAICARVLIIFDDRELHSRMAQSYRPVAVALAVLIATCCFTDGKSARQAKARHDLYERRFAIYAAFETLVSFHRKAR